jgi:hypothetical protein
LLQWPQIPEQIGHGEIHKISYYSQRCDFIIYNSAPLLGADIRQDFNREFVGLGYLEVAWNAHAQIPPHAVNLCFFCQWMTRFQQQQKIFTRFYFTFLLVDGRIQILYRSVPQNNDGSGSGRPITDPTDPDPQHWLLDEE